MVHWHTGPVAMGNDGVAVLSVPLTVCLVSRAKHVPQLELLDQLFGETQK